MTRLAVPSRLSCEPAEVIDHPSGFLALSPRNRFFELPEAAGFIAFREQGIHWFAFGGVHADEADRGRLLDAFLDRARQRRRRVVAVQIRSEQVDLFGERGFAVNRFGTSYGVSLTDFSLAGTRRMKARQKSRQAAKAGFRVLEVGADCPRDDEVFSQLREISAGWLGAKQKKELEFMVGEIGTVDDDVRRIFVAIGPDDAMQGFITYVPVWGQTPGYLHDLTRRRPDAAVGVMELCNVAAIERFREEGARYLHFGFTPFAFDGPEESRYASPLLAKLARLLWSYGGKIYPAQSQVAYKTKWGPTLIEPEYLACQTMSLRAVWDLLVLTRSV